MRNQNFFITFKMFKWSNEKISIFFFSFCISFHVEIRITKDKNSSLCCHNDNIITMHIYIYQNRYEITLYYKTGIPTHSVTHSESHSNRRGQRICEALYPQSKQKHKQKLKQRVIEEPINPSQIQKWNC